MSVIQSHRQALHIALVLMLCVLMFGACRNVTTPDPTTGLPTAEPQAQVERPTATPEPVVPTLEPTLPPPTQTPAPTATPEPLEASAEPPSEDAVPGEAGGDVSDEEDGEDVAETEESGEGEVVETPESTPTATIAPPVQPPGAVATLPRDSVVDASALVLREDETVAPPLTILVSANRQLEGYRYKVSGLVRNDDAVPYASLGVVATFYRSDGSRYGPVRADMQCPILGPGDVCPFIIEVTDKDLAEVMLHPEGRPTDRRQPAPVQLRTGGRYTDAIGYVHITGSVYNPNPFAVQDITINGVLLDGGQIVSIGRDLILGPVAAGANAPFDVMVRYTPYSQTQLYVQALPPN